MCAVCPPARQLTIDEVTPFMLAIFRGCDETNDCLSDCIEAARWSIDTDQDPHEIAVARKWASGERWLPDPRDADCVTP